MKCSCYYRPMALPLIEKMDILYVSISIKMTMLATKMPQ